MADLNKWRNINKLVDFIPLDWQRLFCTEDSRTDTLTQTEDSKRSQQPVLKKFKVIIKLSCKVIFKSPVQFSVMSSPSQLSNILNIYS